MERPAIWKAGRPRNLGLQATANFSKAPLPGGPKHGIKRDPMPAQANLNC